MFNIKIDREYSSTWWAETEYLLQHNIRYSFVKEVDGVTTWKFKKTPDLFLNLANFYSEVYSK